VEENIITGGFGSACAELLVNEKVEVEIAALPREFIPHGDNKLLLDQYGLNEQKLCQRVYNTWFKDRG